MQLFCQACQSAYAGASHCPKCGGRLLSPQESFIFSGTPKDPPPDTVPPTLGNRVVIGAGVGLGLYFGLREIALACGAAPGGSVLTDGGALDFGLRLFAVLAGALFAGAGRVQGLPVGLAAGAAAAGLMAAGDIVTAGGPAAAGPGPLIAAVVLALLAGPAGVIGARVWPPEPVLPHVAPPKGSSRGSSLGLLVEEGAELNAPRPTVWPQVVLGAAIAVAGMLASDEIRYFLARGSGGMLHTAGAHRGPAVGFQIAVILLGLGGIISGAATGAGFRHGVLTGVLAAVGVVSAAANRPDAPYPAIDGYFLTFERAPEPVTDTAAGAEILGLVAGLCTAGGWLGGQLFLPLAPTSMRKRRLSAPT